MNHLSNVFLVLSLCILFTTESVPILYSGGQTTVFQYQNVSYPAKKYNLTGKNIVPAIQEATLIITSNRCHMKYPYMHILSNGIALRIVLTRFIPVTTFCDSLIQLFPDISFYPCINNPSSLFWVKLDQGFWVESSLPTFLLFHPVNNVILDSSFRVYANGHLFELEIQCNEFSYQNPNEDVLQQDTIYTRIVFPERRGFHNQILFSGVTTEKVSTLSIAFPSGIFVDMDSLSELVRKKVFPSFITYPSFIDIESPASQAAPFLLVLSFPPTRRIHITIPIHLRYSFALDDLNDSAVLNHPNQPTNSAVLNHPNQPNTIDPFNDSRRTTYLITSILLYHNRSIVYIHITHHF